MGFGFISAIEIRYWGIKAGKEVGVIFAWNEKTQKWLDELPNETQTAINNGQFATWMDRLGWLVNIVNLPPPPRKISGYFWGGDTFGGGVG